MARLLYVGSLVVRYAVWVALAALGLWAVLEVRLNVLDVAIWMRTSRWALPAVDKFLTAPLILLWLGVTIWLEHYLTEPKDTRVFWRRAGRIAARMTGVLVASYILQVLL